MRISRKFIAKLLLGILAAGSIASSTTLADDYMYVKAEHLNVRSVASVKGKIVAVIDSGYKVTILESLNNGWRKVLLENGQVGYVNGHYLVSQEPYYEKVVSARYTIKSGTAFMRGFDLRRKVAVLNAGDVLEVTSDKIYMKRWVQVKVLNAKHPRYNGRVGYVAKWLMNPIEGYAYIQPEQPQADQNAEAPASAETTNTEDQLPDLNSADNQEAPEDTVTPTEDTSTEDAPTEEDAPSTTTDETSDDSADSELMDILKGL